MPSSAIETHDGLANVTVLQVIAMDVVNPDDISVGFEDIGGMFDVKQALVRTASSSRSWERWQRNRRGRISCLV